MHLTSKFRFSHFFGSYFGTLSTNYFPNLSCHIFPFFVSSYKLVVSHIFFASKNLSRFLTTKLEAFLFLDDDTKERSDSNALNMWKKLGWQIKSVTLQAGSEFVTGARLTSKLLKFTPPSWLLYLG